MYMSSVLPLIIRQLSSLRCHLELLEKDPTASNYQTSIGMRRVYIYCHRRQREYDIGPSATAFDSPAKMVIGESFLLFLT